MIKILVVNRLKCITYLLKKERYKLEGCWKCYFIEEPTRASFVQPRKLFIRIVLLPVH